MEWIKITITTTTFGAEVVTGLLMEAGINGSEILDPRDRVRHLKSVERVWDYVDEALMEEETDSSLVLFYVPKNDAGEALIDDVRARLKELDFDSSDVGCLTLSLESAHEENWANEWKKHFKPLRIDDVVIVPEWENYAAQKGDIILNIDPGSAFGTGQHQTTQLCISALQRFVKPDKTVLDVGCGSGILSILSLILGARHAYAIDIDPAGAMSATKRNGELNPIDMDCLTIKSGDIITDKDLRTEVGANKFDVVVANIVADVIIELAPLVHGLLKPDGFFIASGIITERKDDVLASFKRVGINVVWQEELEGWVCLAGEIS